MASKKSKRTRSISVDFEGVESGGFNLADGTYVAEIASAEEKESSEGNPMLLIKWKVKGKNVTLFDNISLLPQALWRLKTMLEAIDIEVPDSAMDVDLDDLESQSCKLEVTNETYEGKERPKVTNYLPLEDKGGEEAEEEEEETEEEAEEEDSKPARNPGKKTAGKKPKEEEVEEEEEEEEERLKAGAKVKFKDEKGKVVKGKITAIEDDTATVKDTDGDEWELDLSDLEAL
jgi:hypothetical protein